MSASYPVTLMNPQKHTRSRPVATSNRLLSADEFHPVAQFVMSSALHSPENRKQARTAILDWAGNARYWREGWGNSIPDKAYDGQPFDASDEGVHIEVRADKDSELWCFRVEHDDVRDEAREWCLEAFVADRGSYDELGVRVFCKPGAPVRFVPSSTPALVKTFIQRHQLVDDGSPVTPTCMEAEDDASFNRFIDLLLSRERRLPVVALSQGQATRNGGYALNLDQCARALQGFAHVVALPEEQTYWLSDELGRELSVYGGAVRTYMPGFNAEVDPRDHPLQLAERIEQGGPHSYDQALARRLRAHTVSPERLAQWPERPAVHEVARRTGLRAPDVVARLKRALGTLKRA